MQTHVALCYMGLHCKWSDWCRHTARKVRDCVCLIKNELVSWELVKLQESWQGQSKR